MSNSFYIPEKIDIDREKIIKSFRKPLKYFLIISIIALVYCLVDYYFLPPNSIKAYTIFDIAILGFISCFLLDFSRRTIISLLSFALLLLFSSHIIIQYHNHFFTSNSIFQSIHLMTIWLFTPFLFTFITNKYLIDLPYKFFLNMHTHTLKNVDLFSSTKKITEHHTKDDIYIDIILQTEESDDELLKIKTMYLRLIKFWYAQKNYIFKLRYYFPLFISLSSIIYFFYLLDFIKTINIIHNTDTTIGIQQMALVSISLTIFYFTMTHHINNFLHSKFYMSNILDQLNKIYFDKHEYKQQLKLFLDKNFLIYIHDRNHDKHFCVNESKDFQNFISNEVSDEEGRNLIIMVYISFFIILFIETSTGDLLNSPNSPKNNTIMIEKRK